MHSHAVKCVAFDFDGVLVDSNAIKREAYFEIFESLGSDGSQIVCRVLARDGERDRYDVIRAIVGEALATERFGDSRSEDALVTRYVREYHAVCDERVASCNEIPGASEVLPRLAGRCALYVNSSTPDDPLRRAIRRRGWQSHFRGVYGSNHRKVDNLARAVRREGVEPGAAAFVGDAEIDRCAASRAGWRFIAMEHADNGFKETPACLCADMYEVEAAVLGA
jgi:phosphoglycolate phosphatase